MSFHIEQKEEIRVVGIRRPLAEEAEENHRKIPQFWQKAFAKGQVERICSFGNQKPRGILGVSEYKGPQAFHYYIAAATDSPVPEGMYECVIPSATWVVFESDGRFKESVQDIFRRFIPNGFRFPAMSTQAYRISKYTRRLRARRRQGIRRYGSR